MLSTVMVMAIPGKTASHQPREKKVRASLRIKPQVGVEGLTPNPKKERPASAKIAAEMLTVICTIDRIPI